MSAEAASLTRSWRVGSRQVTMTIPRAKPGAMRAAAIEWWPDAPPRLTGSEWHEYRSGRDAAMAELAAELGINIAVLEL
jgi:hypothetical protein